MATINDRWHSRCKSFLKIVDDDTQSKLSSDRCGGQVKLASMVACAGIPAFGSTHSLSHCTISQVSGVHYRGEDLSRKSKWRHFLRFH